MNDAERFEQIFLSQVTRPGAYDDAFRGGSRALNAAMERTPLVLELHYADMIATQREKNEEVL